MRWMFGLVPVVLVVSLSPALSIRSAGAVPLGATFPPAIEEYLSKTARLSASERTDLAAGKPVTKLLDADPNTEIAVFGGVWIAAAPSDYVTRVTDIETFEHGGPFVTTKKISSPPVPADFAALTLPESDLKDLEHCRVGDCNLKLGTGGIDAVHAAVDWKKPDAKAQANAAFRRLALDLVAAYREGGDDRLAVYRDKGRPTFVAKEFRTMVDALPSFGASFPDLKQFLLGYPRATLAGSNDFLYWQQVQFGVKPTIRISHVVVQEQPDRTIVASKLLYASHYFWTGLAVRVLLPDPSRGPGFWLISVSRTRSDGLSGFTGKFVRGRARGDAQKATLTQLTQTKTVLERR
jgi:hypothetical protein